MKRGKRANWVPAPNFPVAFGDRMSVGNEGRALKLSSRALGTLRPGRKDRPAGDAARPEPPFADLLDFDELVLTLEPELRRFVARRVRPEAVDDVLQEIWVAAWQALPGFSQRAKLRTWLYGISLHKCHDRYRAQRSEASLVPIDDLPLVDARPSVEDAVAQADAVSRLLGKLDETQREVVELYYYAQLTLAEIASVLDRNLNTVKYQFYRAHAELASAGELEGLR